MRKLIVSGIVFLTVFSSCDFFWRPNEPAHQGSSESPYQGNTTMDKDSIRETIFHSTSVYALGSTGSSVEVGIPTVYSEVADKAAITCYIGTSEMYTTADDEVFNASVSVAVNEEIRERGSVVFKGLDPMKNYSVIFVGSLPWGSRDMVSGNVSTGGILTQLTNPIDEWIRDDGFWNLDIDPTTGELLIHTTPQVMAVDYEQTGNYFTRFIENSTAFSPWVDYGYVISDLEVLVEESSGVSSVYYLDYQRDADGIRIFFRTYASNRIYMVKLTEVSEVEVLTLQPPEGMTATTVAVSAYYTYFGNSDQVVRIGNFDPSTAVILENYDQKWEKGPNDIAFISDGKHDYVLLALGMTFSQHHLEIFEENPWRNVGTYYCKHAYRVASDDDAGIIFVSHGYDVDEISVFALDREL